MKNREKKSSWARAIGTFLLRTLAVIGTFVLILAATVLICLKMFCSDAFPHVQQTFVTTVLETGQMKFLASVFLSSEEIQEIVDQNSMKAFNAEVNTDLIQRNNFGNVGVQMEQNGEETEEIEIFEVMGMLFSY